MSTTFGSPSGLAVGQQTAHIPGFSRSTLAGEFGRYFAASLFALLADMLVFSAASRVLGLSIAWAATVGFLVGVALAYALSVHWVFRSRRLRRHRITEAMIFLAVGLMGLAVTQAVLLFTTSQLRLSPEIGKLAAAGASFVSNYLVRRALLFTAYGRQGTREVGGDGADGRR